jgi:hypothetical protein
MGSFAERGIHPIVTRHPQRLLGGARQRLLRFRRPSIIPNNEITDKPAVCIDGVGTV